MNLENKSPKPGGDDYKTSDFDDYTEEVKETRAETEPDSGDKMQRILAELADIKTDVAAKMNAKRAAAPSPAPKKEESVKTEDGVILNEINRLREESIRAQTSQEIRSQLTKMKEELAREMSLRGNAQGIAIDPAVLSEIRRITDRLDSIERGRAVAPYPIAREAYAPPMPYATTVPDPTADLRLMTKTMDEIRSRLLDVDKKLGELSTMALANDISPLAREFLDLKGKLSDVVTQIKADDRETDLDVTDKILDELVRLQSTVEDVKKSVDELGEGSNRRMLFETPIPEETSSVQTDRTDAQNVRETLRGEMEQGLNALSEQISSLHADLKIYAEEGLYASAPQRQEGLSTELSDKLSALSKNLDILTIQGAETRPDIENALALLQDLREYSGAGMEKLEEKLDNLRGELEDLKLGATAENVLSQEVAAHAENEMSEVSSIVDSDAILSAIGQDFNALKDFIQEEMRSSAAQTTAVQNYESELIEIKTSLEELAARIRPVDLSPVVNTIAALRAPESETTNAEFVDLTPVVEVVERLETKLDAVRLSQMAQSGANDGGASEVSATQLSAVVGDAIARLENKIDRIKQDASEDTKAQETDLTPLTDAVTRLEAKLDALRAVQAARSEQYELDATKETAVSTAIARFETKLDAFRQAQMSGVSYPKQSAPESIDAPMFTDALLRLENKLDALRQLQSSQRISPSTGVDSVTFSEAVARLENKLENIRQKQNLTGTASAPDRYGALADAVARMDAKLDGIRQTQASQSYANVGSPTDNRVVTDALVRVEAKLDLALRKLDGIRPTDNTEVLSAITALRAAPNTDRDIIDAITTLRREVSALSAVSAVGRTVQETNEGILRRIVKEELRNLRPVASEKRSGITAGEIAATAEPVTLRKTTVGVGASKTTVKRASAKKAVAKKTVTAVKPVSAPKAKAAAVKSMTKTTAAKNAAAGKSAAKTVSANTPAKKAPTKSVSAPKPAVRKETPVRKTTKKSETSLTAADSIARQVALKLLLEQLRIEPQTSKARKQKVLNKVRESENVEAQLLPTPESIRQHANRLVLERLIREVGEED